MPIEFKDFNWYVPAEFRDFDWYMPVEICPTRIAGQLPGGLIVCDRRPRNITNYNTPGSDG